MISYLVPKWLRKYGYHALLVLSLHVLFWAFVIKHIGIPEDALMFVDLEAVSQARLDQAPARATLILSLIAMSMTLLWFVLRLRELRTR